MTPPSPVAAVVTGPDHLELRPFPWPTIGSEDGILAVAVSGVCGSDPKYLGGMVPSRRNWPFILGHEIVGRIVEAGPDALRRWRVGLGELVFVVPHAGCGRCEWCRRGAARLCPDRLAYGGKVTCDLPPHLWGGFADHVYLPPNAEICALPAGMAPELGVFAGILGDSLRWVRDAGSVRVGDTVVVQGVGPQGLCAVIAAREAGAGTVIAAGLSADAVRLALAREVGATVTVDVERESLLDAVASITGGRLADVTLELSGSPTAVQASIEITRPLGTVVMAGLNGDRAVSVQTDHLVWKELRWQGVFACEGENIRRALDIIASGRYPFERMITHRFPLAQSGEALRIVGGRDVGTADHSKVVLEIGNAGSLTVP